MLSWLEMAVLDGHVLWSEPIRAAYSGGGICLPVVRVMLPFSEHWR